MVGIIMAIMVPKWALNGYYNIHYQLSGRVPQSGSTTSKIGSFAERHLHMEAFHADPQPEAVRLSESLSKGYHTKVDYRIP